MLRAFAFVSVLSLSVGTSAARRPVAASIDVPRTTSTDVLPLVLPAELDASRPRALLEEAAAALAADGHDLAWRGLRLIASGEGRVTSVHLVDATGECFRPLVSFEGAGDVVRLALATRGALESWSCLPSAERRLRDLHFRVEKRALNSSEGIVDLANVFLTGALLLPLLEDEEDPLGFSAFLIGGAASVGLGAAFTDWRHREALKRAALFTSLGFVFHDFVHAEGRPVNPVNEWAVVGTGTMFATALWQAFHTAGWTPTSKGTLLAHAERLRERAKWPVDAEAIATIERDLDEDERGPSCWLLAAPSLAGGAAMTGVAAYSDNDTESLVGMLLGAGVVTYAAFPCLLNLTPSVPEVGLSVGAGGVSVRGSF